MALHYAHRRRRPSRSPVPTAAVSSPPLRLEVALLVQELDELLRHLLRRLQHAVLLAHLHDNLGLLRLLVRVVDAVNPLDLARARRLVQPLRVRDSHTDSGIFMYTSTKSS